MNGPIVTSSSDLGSHMSGLILERGLADGVPSGSNATPEQIHGNLKSGHKNVQFQIPVYPHTQGATMGGRQKNDEVAMLMSGDIEKAILDCGQFSGTPLSIYVCERFV